MRDNWPDTVRNINETIRKSYIREMLIFYINLRDFLVEE